MPADCPVVCVLNNAVIFTIGVFLTTIGSVCLDAEPDISDHMCGSVSGSIVILFMGIFFLAMEFLLFCIFTCTS